MTLPSWLVEKGTRPPGVEVLAERSRARAFTRVTIDGELITLVPDENVDHWTTRHRPLVVIDWNAGTVRCCGPSWSTTEAIPGQEE